MSRWDVWEAILILCFVGQWRQMRMPKRARFEAH
jgi:hypothetical protein